MLGLYLLKPHEENDMMRRGEHEIRKKLNPTLLVKTGCHFVAVNFDFQFEMSHSILADPL
jgi:hypothetical protein